MKKKKVLFSDLDGTIINTISGNTFPKGVWDMKIDFELLDKIKEYGFEAICIITNQGGVEEGFVDMERWINKAKYVCDCIKEYTGIRCDYESCFSNNKNNVRRKPNIGMVMEYLNDSINVTNANNWECLMIGDASGLEGQFSDSDKKYAENAGIEYMDVLEFKNKNYGKV